MHNAILLAICLSLSLSLSLSHPTSPPPFLEYKVDTQVII